MPESINSNLQGMYAARELIKLMDIEGLRDMSVREIENHIYDKAAELKFGYMDREAFKRAFVRELNAAIFYIYY